MVRKIIYCDRCRKECEMERCNHGLHVFKSKFFLKKANEDHLDLCAKCYDSLAEWMDNKKDLVN